MLDKRLARIQKRSEKLRAKIAALTLPFNALVDEYQLVQEIVRIRPGDHVRFKHGDDTLGGTAQGVTLSDCGEVLRVKVLVGAGFDAALLTVTDKQILSVDKAEAA